MIPLNDPDIRRRTTPYVVYAIVALNVLVALYQLILTDVAEIAFTYRYGVVPWELVGRGVLGVESFRFGFQTVSIDLTSPVPTWATMFTSMFVHGGLLHLGGNMLFLWVFGDNVEDRFGHLTFLAFYLATGVAAVWGQVLVDPSSQVPMVGASGAIAGVLGGYLMLFPHSRVHTLIFFGFIFHARLPALVLIGGWALLQAFSGFGSLGVSAAGSGVAYFAHVGGFAAGVGLIAAWRFMRGQPIWPGRPGGGPGQYWRGRRIDDD